MDTPKDEVRSAPRSQSRKSSEQRLPPGPEGVKEQFAQVAKLVHGLGTLLAQGVPQGQEPGEDTVAAMPAVATQEIVVDMQRVVVAMKQNVMGQLEAFKSTNEDLEKQISQQQEDFFNQMQKREMQIQEKEQEILRLKEEAKQKSERQSSSRPSEEQAVPDGGSIPALSMKNEEGMAKARKDILQKYQKESQRLKELLSGQSASLEAAGLKSVENLESLMSKLNSEDKERQRIRIKLDSKIKTLQDSNAYLESRITQMISEKEEEIIKLKSEVIVYKQKGKQYKEQMLTQKRENETKSEQLLQERVQAAKNQFIDDMRQFKDDNLRLKGELNVMTEENKELQVRCQELEREFNTLNTDKNEEIAQLKDTLLGIESKHDRKLKKVTHKKTETENKLNVEEKERELFGLKLEQVLMNNKKLQLQKKFLEKQLDKDLREIHIEMNKIEIDIQQDQLLGPNSALHRFRSVYQQVSDQLQYIQQIVGFMEFDQEGVPGGSKSHFDHPQQPQTFEDVARDIQEKIQAKQSHEQMSHDQMVGSDNLPDVPTGAGNSPRQMDGSGGSQEMLSANKQGRQLDGEGGGSALRKRSGGYANQNEQASRNDLSMQQLSNQSAQMQQERQMQMPSLAQPLQRSYTQQPMLNELVEFQAHPMELICAVMNTLMDIYRETEIFPSENLAQLSNIVNSRVQQAVVKEVQEKYLNQNKIQFQQYLHRYMDRCKELEIDNKNLQFRVKRAQLDMKRVDYQGPTGAQSEPREGDIDQYSVEQIDEDGAPTTEPSRAGLGPQATAEQKLGVLDSGREDARIGFADEQIENVSIDEDKSEDPMEDIDAGIRSASKLKQRPLESGPAVPVGASKASYQQMVEEIESLKQQNQALKERCKEIRLNLQRKITELQDTQIITKQKFLSEISALKVEYGQDLSRVTRTNEEKQEDLVKQMEKLKEDELLQLHNECEMEKRELEEKMQQNQEEAQRQIEKVVQEKKDAIAELTKLKGESTGYSKGGWGTFVLAFEDLEATQRNAEKAEKKGKNNLKTPRSSSSRAKLPSKASHDPLESHRMMGTSRTPETNQEGRTSRAEFDTHPHPIQKINHFIEVGFLMDQNNFRLLDRHEELTYDNVIKKYLFELQDPMSNYQMNDLEFKIKQQLMDNVGLFNDINPLYISLNMGRPAEPFFDTYIPQEQFRLIEREGIYLMGNRWMMINFLKCDNLAPPAPVHTDITQANRTNISKISSEEGAMNVANTTKNGPTLRVIAFENATMSQLAFDLNYYDLLTLMHGNMKLLEDENSHDLCQIILNNLTLIQREKLGETDKLGNPILQDYLIVEHRIFFNEQYRAVYDKKNKNIMAKYDKKRQGLVQDVALNTDFEKSVIHEAFHHVYRDTIQMPSAHNENVCEPIDIEILSGAMSGNTLLRATFLNIDKEVREMCLFSDGQARSQKICSEIVHVPPKIIATRSSTVTCRTGENDHEIQEVLQPLAYVISIEKLFGQDQILVVRLVVIEKWDQNVMLDYSWSPESRPQEGSTQFRSETIYLVKKSDFQYCRVAEYEILNTEIRTLLFMHAYGYIQANADFGNIRRYLEQGELRRVSYLSGLGSEEYFKEALNVNIQDPALLPDYNGLNQLLYRKYCIVRVRKYTYDQTTTQSSPQMDDIEEQSMTNSQVKGSLKKEPQLVNLVGDPSNFDALVAIFVDGQCLERSEVIIKVVIQELQVDIIQNVFVQKEILSRESLGQMLIPEKREELCGQIINQLILEEYVAVGQAALNVRQLRRLELVLDSEIQPMTAQLLEAKQKTFEEMLRHEEGRETDDNIQMEIKDVAAMMIPLTTLANCPKTSINSILNQKPYKITAYFVFNQPGFEPSIPEANRMFDWRFIYLEVMHRTADQQMAFAITEKDIVTIMQQHRQKLRVEGKELRKSLVYKNMPREEVLTFIMDCLVMDPVTSELSLSMIHLSQRVYERSLLEERFVISGGRFITLKDGIDPEMEEFKTQVPNTELTCKLLNNNQKEMSDKGFDVKLYELQLKSIPGTKKIRFEIFWLDDPEMVFRCDMFSNENQDSSQIIIEKINIVEHIEYLKLQNRLITQDQYNPSKFAKDGLVLAICESNFPHDITFMLIEPCSHIQWEYSYQDDKLNVIESRQQKLNFVANLRDAFQNGILRGIEDPERAMKIQVGDQEFIGEEQVKDTFYVVGELEQVLSNSRRSQAQQAIYSQSLQVVDGVYRNLRIFSDARNDSLIFRLEHLEIPKELPSVMGGGSLSKQLEELHTSRDSSLRQSKQLDQLRQSKQSKQSMQKDTVFTAQAFQRLSNKQYSDIFVKLNSQMEGSRIVSGAISYDFGQEDNRSMDKNLIYTIEVSCALEREQRAIRVSLYDQSKKKTIVNVVFMDEFLYGRQGMTPEVNFALRSGFTDSMAILQKISCLNPDFHKLEQQEEIRSKMEDKRSVDLYSDFSDQRNPPRNRSKVPAKPQRPSRDEESTFVSLTKLKERMINKSLKENTLVYRKVMKLKGGTKNLMLSVLKESNPMYSAPTQAQTRTLAQSSTRPPIQHDEFLIKLILSENKRVDIQSNQEKQINKQTSEMAISEGTFGYNENESQMRNTVNSMRSQMQPQTLHKVQDHIFVYRYDEIFSLAEIKLNEGSIHELKTLRRMVTYSISKRLRIREIPDILNLNQMQSKIQSSNISEPRKDAAATRYVAFFVDEDFDQRLPKNPVTENVDILEGRSSFDMRYLHSFALLDPQIKVLPWRDKKAHIRSLMKESLIYQFEKDDLLYDIFEVLNAEELQIRIKVYQKETYIMLTSCEIGETELKAQLIKDRRSFLTGSTQREELAKYIIENSFFDEDANSLRFMISDLVEEI